MTLPEPTDVEVEISGRRYVAMSDGTWAVVSREEPSHWWEEWDPPEAVVKPLEISPSQGHLFEQPPGILKVLNQLEGLSKASSAFTRHHNLLRGHRIGEKSKLSSIKLQSHLEKPLGEFFGKAEEDPCTEDQDVRKQLEEIRSALQESRQLGESSERRLKELRQRNG